MKGISLILYTDADHARYQAFAFQNWRKGRYETPTLLGSRSGGPLASAWAVMQYLGHAGYAGLTRRLMRLRDDYLERIADIPELTVLGTPPLSVLAVALPSLDMFGRASEMTARGWFMSLVAEPLAFQQTLTLAHERTIDEYSRDLREIIMEGTQAPRHPGTQAPRHPGTQAPDSAAVPTRRWEITTYWDTVEGVITRTVVCPSPFGRIAIVLDTDATASQRNAAFVSARSRQIAGTTRHRRYPAGDRRR